MEENFPMRPTICGMSVVFSYSRVVVTSIDTPGSDWLFSLRIVTISSETSGATVYGFEEPNWFFTMLYRTETMSRVSSMV